jgi:hypothetical protein
MENNTTEDESSGKQRPRPVSNANPSGWIEFKNQLFQAIFYGNTSRVESLVNEFQFTHDIKSLRDSMGNTGNEIFS